MLPRCAAQRAAEAARRLASCGSQLGFGVLAPDGAAAALVPCTQGSAVSLQPADGACLPAAAAAAKCAAAQRHVRRQPAQPFTCVQPGGVRQPQRCGSQSGCSAAEPPRCAITTMCTAGSPGRSASFVAASFGATLRSRYVAACQQAAAAAATMPSDAAALPLAARAAMAAAAAARQAGSGARERRRRRAERLEAQTVCWLRGQGRSGGAQATLGLCFDLAARTAPTASRASWPRTCWPRSGDVNGQLRAAGGAAQLQRVRSVIWGGGSGRNDRGGGSRLGVGRLLSEPNLSGGQGARGSS